MIVREKYLEKLQEFEHYGVLGMKWGIHRSKVNKAKANRARSKGKIKKAEKYEAKSEKIKQKHINRTDKKTYDRVSKKSVKKLLAQSMLMGTYGSLKYNQSRSEGAARFESFAKGYGYAILNGAFSGIPSFVGPRINARNAKKQIK